MWRLVLCVFASGCSVFGSGSAGLNRRCERALPALDTAIAISAVTLAIAIESASDGEDRPTAEIVGVGVTYGASAFIGYSKASRCRRRDEEPVAPRQIASVRDEFLGERQWRTTMWVYPRESPLYALERAYQRAAAICEGRGLHALEATRLAPRRPTQVTLTFRCH